MKKCTMLVLFFGYLFCTGVFGQTDLTGTWQGKLAVSPNEQMIIQFILARQANGSYTALVNSPDTGAIKNVPATGVKLAGSTLTIDVVSLSGSYSGSVGKGVITGAWKQEGSSIPLVLTPFKAPAVSTLKPLLGEWVGTVEPPGAGKIVTVVRFEMTKDGKFAGFLSAPEQGGNQIAIEAVTLEGNQVTFKVPAAQAEYEGKLIGTKIEGMAKQAGQQFKLDLIKGKYELPAFNITAEGMKRLSGEWVGNTGPNRLTIVFRFEPAQTAKVRVFMDVPDQRVTGVAAREFTLKGDEVTITLPGQSGDTYTGLISATSLKGTFKLNNVNQELNLTKGKFGVADMPAEDMKRLLGQWVGKYAPGGPTYTIVWKFERTADGKLRALATAPETGPDELPMSNLTLKGDQLNFRIPATGGDFTGKINNNSLSGTYKASGQELQLTVVRGAKYEKPTTQLDVPAESLQKLMGTWNGTIGPLSAVLRFERTAAGKVTVLQDIPSQNIKDTIVSKVSMKDADLLLKLPDGSDIALKLTGNKLEGTIKSGQTSLPVSLRKQ